MEEFPNNVVECKRGRKRIKNVEEWTKTKKKYARNSIESRQKPFIACNHTGKTKLCAATKELTNEDMNNFFSLLYAEKSKIDQDNFLMKYMVPGETKSKRPRNDVPRERISVNYFIRKLDGNNIKVCVKTFESIAQIGRKRINAIAKHFLLHGNSRNELRGGSRVSDKHKEITASISNHILSLKCRESHYGRQKSIRSYLPPHLSVKKLWRTWKSTRRDENKSTASYNKYFKIFATKFNLGFGNPRSDVCSFCELTKSQVSKENDPDEKQKLITKYRLHVLRAKRFYKILKHVDSNVIKVCFDMQQNQPLPKLNIGEVFYARQIWLYNFTIMVHEDHQNKNNTFVYTWTENQTGRGLNEIASAMIDFLSTHLQQLVNSKPIHLRPKILRIFSDSCPSQNKNSIVLAALLNFTNSCVLFDRVEHVFPIRGHSFMPPDRLFGRIEKVIRKEEKILTPAEYHNLFREHATVKILGHDWEVYDYKNVSQKVIKRKLPFKLTDTRVIIYTKGSNEIKTKEVYFGAPHTHDVLRKNVHLNEEFNSISKSQPVNHISGEKRSDVLKLLQYITLNRDEKNFYDSALAGECNGNDIVVYGSVRAENEPFL